MHEAVEALYTLTAITDEINLPPDRNFLRGFHACIDACSDKRVVLNAYAWMALTYYIALRQKRQNGTSTSPPGWVFESTQSSSDGLSGSKQGARFEAMYQVVQSVLQVRVTRSAFLALMGKGL